ncbi:hypothetical protein CSKR_102358 [Clonorchis sinensis]|uniref:Uncharacterized protein n=2 Tax=Clonorchis sinensis TaxID=79923 RepID=H2KRT2_CLOSI|nr:hypothetical protein CSKR_102358 [Clonorchis sinensis]GAA35219.2 hypothetical protein CLF_107086 [Clonorchis sinensis]
MARAIVYTLGVVVGLLFCRCQARELEHNFARPWLNIKGSIHYPNLTQFWNIIHDVLPSDTPPLAYLSRSRAQCEALEIQQCGAPENCFINRISDNALSMDQVGTITNRAHYRCRCQKDLLPIDFVVRMNKTFHNVSRVIQTRCPEPPACDKCDKEHTVKCIDLGGGKATCICDPEYMEDKNCEKKKDGCTEHHPAASLTGNQACMVYKNNSCFPLPLSLRYSCLCREPFREDKRLSFPNCMDNRTICPRPLCLGFQPPIAVTIPGPTIILDETHTFEMGGENDSCYQKKCSCPEGWLGPHCSEKRGELILGSWSPWSTCNPDCIMPNERMRYKQMDDLHAGTSRTTAIGYKSKFARCTVGDLDFCVGTFRFWRRCRVTTLCNAWTNSRLSTVVNHAIAQAMIEHDKVHRPDRVEPILTTAAELTWEERHCLNFIVVAGALIYSCITIWTMELHHLIVNWNSNGN